MSSQTPLPSKSSDPWVICCNFEYTSIDFDFCGKRIPCCLISTKEAEIQRPQVGLPISQTKSKDRTSSSSMRLLILCKLAWSEATPPPAKVKSSFSSGHIFMLADNSTAGTLWLSISSDHCFSGKFC